MKKKITYFILILATITTLLGAYLKFSNNPNGDLILKIGFLVGIITLVVENYLFKRNKK